MELQGALAQAKLSQFYEQFKDAGCEEIADVAGMDDAAILALGLKDVQLKRLRRTFEKQGGAKAAEAIPVAYAAPVQMSPQALANQQAMMNERTAPSAQQAALVLARRSTPHRTARTRVGATIWGSLIKAPLNYGFP